MKPPRFRHSALFLLVVICLLMFGIGIVMSRQKEESHRRGAGLTSPNSGSSIEFLGFRLPWFRSGAGP
jgi:hypothetical protein